MACLKGLVDQAAFGAFLLHQHAYQGLQRFAPKPERLALGMHFPRYESKTLLILMTLLVQVTF